jgi:uncharacterized protein YgiM (DUF1202 family)
MPKLIIVSSFMLFVLFYFMSGGADFEPREREIVSQAPFGGSNQRAATYYRPVTASQVATANAVVTTQRLGVIVEDPVVSKVVAEVVIAAAVTVETRVVGGSRVNLRAGPGTSHPVITTLSRGDVVEIVTVTDGGWAQIRLIDSEKTGWMAERLLSDG